MDRLLLGLSTTGVGMLVVFSGLVILIACIYCMTSITGRKKRAAQMKPVPVPPPPAFLKPEAEEKAEEQDDTQLAAVIAAAVAAVWQSEGKESGFIVRRIRRVQTATARARAARDEQIYSRL